MGGLPAKQAGFPFAFFARLTLRPYMKKIPFFPCNQFLLSCIYEGKSAKMKRFVSVLLFAAFGSSAFAQQSAIISTVKKKMLGVYNTTSVALMPVSRSNYVYAYDVYYPYYYGVESRTGFSIRNTTGYRFFDKLNVGAGFGLDNFESSALNIPFYGEVSGNFLNKRFFPGYYAQAGYGVGINITKKDSPNRVQKVEGGLMAAAGISFGGRLDKNTILRINFGYRLQKATYTSEVPQYNMPPYTLIRHMSYHRVEVGLSFTFQQ